MAHTGRPWETLQLALSDRVHWGASAAMLGGCSVHPRVWFGFGLGLVFMPTVVSTVGWSLFSLICPFSGFGVKVAQGGQK